MKKSLFLLIFIISQTFTWGQIPVISKLSEKEGLPDEEIYDILEDKKGYIWIAANKGLYRYNGKTFEHFTHPLKRGLSVFGLLEDEFGNIWCNNISGQFFYVKKNKLHFFIDLNNEINGQLPEFKIVNKNLIALTEKGVLKIDFSTRKKKIITDKTTQSSLYFSPFLHENTFYFIHGNQIKKLNNETVEHLASFDNKAIKNSTYCFTKERNIILLQKEQPTFYLWKSNQFIAIQTPKILQNKIILRILFKENKYWITTNKGLFVFKWKSNGFDYLYTFLENDFISKIICDRNSNYWISSTQSGLYTIPSTSILKIDLKESEIATSLTKINDDLIAFGTNIGEIGFYSITLKSIQYFQLPDKRKINHIVFHKHSNTLIISNDQKGFILELKNGNLYEIKELASAKDLVFKDSSTLLVSYYNKAQWVKIPFLNQTTTWNFILPKSIQVKQTTITVTTKTIREKRAYACSTVSNYNYVAYVDNFIANSNKVIINNKKPIFTVDIENKDQAIWVSTFENGLLKIIGSKITDQLNTNNGLLSNYTGVLKATKDGLWIVTDKGLQFYSNKREFKNLFRGNGLETYDFKRMESVGNYLFLTSNKGMYAINTQTIFNQNPIPYLFISKIINNEKLVPLNKTIKFNDDENSIQVFFNSTGYQHDYRIQFQYRLKNNNDKWFTIEKGAESLNLSNLADGTYKLQIRIKYDASKYTDYKEINFEILPPFWKRLWFISVLICGFLIGFYFYFQRKLIKTEKAKQLELDQAYANQELIASQLENLRSQMNPHFIFNALNSIQEFIITNDKDTASEYLVKFSRLIRVYLDHSLQNEIPLSDEISALSIYLELEKVRFEDKLNFEININPFINQNFIKVPSLFLQPYVENALKHGLLHKKDNRQLRLNFEIINQNLHIEIIDNGIGLAAAKKMKESRNLGHQSFALSANQKRVQLLNKTRENKIIVSIEEIIENETSKGTKVTILIPIK